MIRGFSGGQEIAHLLLAWLGCLFPEVQFFSVYLVGEFGRVFDRMNESQVNIHRDTVLEFAQGLSQAVQGGLRFTQQTDDKCILFSRLVQGYSTNPDDKIVLLGALSYDIRAVLGGDNQTALEKIALLKTLEPLEEMGFKDYQTVENRKIFRDRLYSTGM